MHEEGILVVPQDSSLEAPIFVKMETEIDEDVKTDETLVAVSEEHIKSDESHVAVIMEDVDDCTVSTVKIEGVSADDDTSSTTSRTKQRHFVDTVLCKMMQLYNDLDHDDVEFDSHELSKVYFDPLKSLKQPNFDSEDLMSLDWLSNLTAKSLHIDCCDGEDSDDSGVVASPVLLGNAGNGNQNSGDSHRYSTQGYHTSQVAYNPQIHCSTKPPYSFSCLIFLAIESSEEKKLPVCSIYSWMQDNFPYFATRSNSGWKNSVRHNLSICKYFERVRKDRHSAVGKGAFWQVVPSKREEMMKLLRKAPCMPYGTHLHPYAKTFLSPSGVSYMQPVVEVPGYMKRGTEFPILPQSLSHLRYLFKSPSKQSQASAGPDELNAANILMRMKRTSGRQRHNSESTADSYDSYESDTDAQDINRLYRRTSSPLPRSRRRHSSIEIQPPPSNDHVYGRTRPMDSADDFNALLNSALCDDEAMVDIEGDSDMEIDDPDATIPYLNSDTDETDMDDSGFRQELGSQSSRQDDEKKKTSKRRNASAGSAKKKLQRLTNPEQDVVQALLAIGHNEDDVQDAPLDLSIKSRDTSYPEESSFDNSELALFVPLTKLDTSVGSNDTFISTE